jgi:hypothetical protein
MVDLYAADGAYLETLVLPARALRIAADGERLYVLRQARDSVLMASYVLPWGIRSRIRAAVPAQARTPGALRGPQGARRVRGGWLPELEPDAPAGDRGAAPPERPAAGPRKR